MVACARSEACEVTIPAGIDDGQRIALEGQGEAGPRGGPNGDLYVAVEVRDHPELVRRGTELFHELPITFPQAALGATLTVPTVEGTEEVAVPAGAQSGHEIRLRGKGVPAAARSRTRRPARGRQRRRAVEAFEARAGAPSGARRGERPGGPAEGWAIGVRLAARPAVRLIAGPMRWLELSVEADVEAVEAVSEILGRVAEGTAVQPTRLIRDPADELSAREDPTAPFVVTAHVADGPDSAGQVDATERALWHLQAFGLRPVGPLRVRPVDDADWTDAWKRHYVPQRIGRIVIVPSWVAYEAAPDDVVVILDPGMAFGTGLHPTTRACLELLQEVSPMPGRVLDVGTGSGILALAALRLGARAVVGYDTDPLAVDAAGANASETGSATDSTFATAPCRPRRGSATRSCSPTSSPPCWSSSRRGWPPTSNRAACSSRAGSSRIAQTRRSLRSRRPGSPSECGVTTASGSRSVSRRRVDAPPILRGAGGDGRRPVPVAGRDRAPG